MLRKYGEEVEKCSKNISNISYKVYHDNINTAWIFCDSQKVIYYLLLNIYFAELFYLFVSINSSRR